MQPKTGQPANPALLKVLFINFKQVEIIVFKPLRTEIVCFAVICNCLN